MTISLSITYMHVYSIQSSFWEFPVNGAYKYTTKQTTLFLLGKHAGDRFKPSEKYNLAETCQFGDC